jgi:hypothetical protein
MVFTQSTLGKFLIHAVRKGVSYVEDGRVSGLRKGKEIPKQSGLLFTKVC